VTTLLIAARDLLMVATAFLSGSAPRWREENVG
jgi:hypothetical protein